MCSELVENNSSHSDLSTHEYNQIELLLISPYPPKLADLSQYASC